MYFSADGKYSRAETDASTVATTLSQSQASTQAHGQAYINPTLPPGYGYYFPGGMMTGGIPHYAPPIFPVSSFKKLVFSLYFIFHTTITYKISMKIL